MKIFYDTQGDAQYYHETAYLGWQNERQALLGISEGYKEAADQLVDFAIESNSRRIKDQFIFPILFNYRHSMEGTLKLIYLRATGSLCGGNHDLLSIWSNIENDVINNKLRNANMCPFDVEKLPLSKIKTGLKELQGANFSSNERAAHPQNDTRADVWRYLMSPQEELYFCQGHWVYYPTLKAGINELYNMLRYLYDEVDEFL